MGRPGLAPYEAVCPACAGMGRSASGARCRKCGGPGTIDHERDRPVTPDAHRVLDADAGRLALTHDEAENVAIVADVLAAEGGGFAWWVEYVLDDIKTGARDRHGRRVWSVT